MEDHWEKKPLSSVMFDGVVAAEALTGASIARRVPVRVTDVDTILFGLLLSVSSPFSCLIFRGQVPDSAPEEFDAPSDDVASFESEEHADKNVVSVKRSAARTRERRDVILLSL